MPNIHTDQWFNLLLIQHFLPASPRKTVLMLSFNIWLFIEGVKCICNQLSLTTKIDAEHPELRNYVKSQGWWNGDSDFNFSEVFSLADDHLACCSGRESLEKQGGKC